MKKKNVKIKKDTPMTITIENKKKLFSACRNKWVKLPLEQKILYDTIAEALNRLSVLNNKQEYIRGFNIFIAKCQHDQEQLIEWLGLND